MDASIPTFNPNSVNATLTLQAPMGVNPLNADATVHGFGPGKNGGGLSIPGILSKAIGLYNGSNYTISATNTITDPNSTDGSKFYLTNTSAVIIKINNQKITIPSISYNFTNLPLNSFLYLTLYQRDPSYTPQNQAYNEVAGGNGYSFNASQGVFNSGGPLQFKSATAVNLLPNQPIYVGSSTTYNYFGGQYAQIATIEGVLNNTYYRAPQQLTPQITQIGRNSVSGTGTQAGDRINLFQSKDGSIPAQGASLPANSVPIGATNVNADGTWQITNLKLNPGVTYYVQESDNGSDLPGYAKSTFQIAPLSLGQSQPLKWSINLNATTPGTLIANQNQTPFNIGINNYISDYQPNNTFSISASSNGINVNNTQVPIYYSADKGQTLKNLTTQPKILSTNDTTTPTTVTSTGPNQGLAAFSNGANFYIKVPSIVNVTSGKNYTGTVNLTLNNTP